MFYGCVRRWGDVELWRWVFVRGFGGWGGIIETWWKKEEDGRRGCGRMDMCVCVYGYEFRVYKYSHAINTFSSFFFPTLMHTYPTYTYTSGR